MLARCGRLGWGGGGVGWDGALERLGEEHQALLARCSGWAGAAATRVRSDVGDVPNQLSFHFNLPTLDPSYMKNAGSGHDCSASIVLPPAYVISHTYTCKPPPHTHMCRERDKTALEQRIARLTHCILHGAAAATQMERRLRAPPSEQAAAAALLAGEGGASTGAGTLQADVGAAVAGVRGAGALFPGEQLAAASRVRGVGEVAEVEADLLRRQVHVLAAELAERDRMLATIHSMRGGYAGDGGGGGGFGGGSGGDDVAMQVGAGALPRWAGAGWMPPLSL